MYNLLDVIEVLGVTDKQMGGIIIWRSHSLTAGESSHFVRKAIMLRPCQRRGAIEGFSTSQLSTTTSNQTKPGCHRRHFHLSIVNNYTKSNLSQLKLNNSSTTLSVCGLE